MAKRFFFRKKAVTFLTVQNCCIKVENGPLTSSKLPVTFGTANVDIGGGGVGAEKESVV